MGLYTGTQCRAWLLWPVQLCWIWQGVLQRRICEQDVHFKGGVVAGPTLAVDAGDQETALGNAGTGHASKRRYISVSTGVCMGQKRSMAPTTQLACGDHLK